MSFIIFMKDQRIEAAKVEEGNQQIFTTKWFNTNERLYSMHLQNISELLTHNSEGSSKYKELIDQYLKNEKNLNKMLQQNQKEPSIFLKQNQEAQSEIQENEKKFETLWKQIQEKSNLNRQQQMKNMLIFTAIKQLLPFYLKAYREHQKISKSNAPEIDLTPLLQLQNERQINLQLMTRVRGEMQKYDQVLDLMTKFQQEMERMNRNKNLREQIQNTISQQVVFNEISKLYEERNIKIDEINSKSKQLEALKLKIQEKKKKSEKLRYEISLLDQATPKRNDNTLDAIYDEKDCNNDLETSSEQYVPKTNTKFILRKKSSTERRIVLLVWSLILMAIIYALC